MIPKNYRINNTFTKKSIKRYHSAVFFRHFDKKSPKYPIIHLLQHRLCKSRSDRLPSIYGEALSVRYRSIQTYKFLHSLNFTTYKNIKIFKTKYIKNT